MNVKMEVGYSMIKRGKSIKNICSKNIEIKVAMEYNWFM